MSARREGTKPTDKTAQAAIRRIVALLVRHLGSAEAAHLWLATKSPEIGSAPLAAIAEGKGRVVLALLESRWGPGPVY